MLAMIHEDWHLISAYHVDGYLEEFIRNILYDDQVHKYIDRYLEQIWDSYMKCFKRRRSLKKEC